MSHNDYEELIILNMQSGIQPTITTMMGPSVLHATDLFESSLARIKRKQQRDKKKAEIEQIKIKARAIPITIDYFLKRTPHKENSNPNQKS